MSAPSVILRTLQTLINRLPGGDSALAPLSRALIRPRDNHIVAYVNPGGELVGASGSAISPRGRSLVENFAAEGAAGDQCTVLGVSGAAFASTTTLLHHIYTPGGNIMACFNVGVQTTPPVMVTAGLDIGGVQTNAIGLEVATHAYGASGKPFIVGSSGAFYAKCILTPGDVSGLTGLAFGFRKLQASQLTVQGYTDYATIGLVAGAITIKSSTTGSSNSTDVTTDTTDTWADGATKTLEVYVDAAGAVTYKVSGSAPTTTAAYTFPDGTPVVPFLAFINASDLADSVVIGKWEAGLQ